MSTSYNALEGTFSVRGTATTSRAGTTNAVAVVGGYDSANAASEVTEGEATTVTDPSSADDTFGTSELARAVQAVAANGVNTIYGIPVSETQNTENISSGTSLTLTETPFDPNVHPDHDITVTDTDTSTDLTVNITYEEPTPTPTEADSANVNPHTKQVEVDASGNYDIDYTYGDYTASIETGVDLPVRNVCVLTEDAGVKSTLQTELASVANDFDFKRGFVGAKPEIQVTDIGTYTPDVTDWRVVEVAPSRGTGADGAVRTCAAIAGFMSSQPIGPDGSGLFDSVSGLTALNTSYRPSEAKNFERVTTITRNGVIGTVDTTTDVGQFKEIYKVEIIDAVALGLFDIVQDYAGGPQDVGDLQATLEAQLQSYTESSPPVLGFGDGRSGRPYSVSASLSPSGDVANVGVSIVPYPIAKAVDLSLTVTDGFVQFDGAN